MPLSKNKIKLIRSLELKKKRREENLFLAEGPKLVGDLMGHFHCAFLTATASWLDEHPRERQMADEWCESSDDDIARASLLRTPKDVIALFRLPESQPANTTYIHDHLCLALDGVQDPGNMGTILRVADWFGIEHIFCSPDTADAFAPKTVQATMGALARVRVHYTPLPQLIQSLPPDTPVYATLLDGENIYRKQDTLQQRGLIIMGNEGNGISEEVRRLITTRLLIPNYPPERATSESLNVAVATAIVCSEFRRQRFL